MTARRLWWTAGTLLLAGGLAFLSGALSSRDTARPAAQAAPPPLKVAVAAAARGPLPASLPGIGTLEAVRQVTVPAEVDGRVTRILFEAGTRVRSGQLLVQLNDTPERGDAARLAAQTANARALLDRTERLLPKQAATQEQLDQARAAHDQTAGELRRVDALIAQKQIVAPFDGALGIRQVQLGQFVRAGDPIVTLTDSRTLFATFTLPEQALPSLRRGQAVTLAVDAYPGRAFTAAITTIEPQVSATARTIRVQALLQNRDGALTPGLFVNARVALPPRADAITVPDTAIISSAYGDAVYIVDASSSTPGAGLTARQAYVKTGARLDGRVVIEEGLAAGTRVVTSGQLRLHNGAPVAIGDHDTLASPAPDAAPARAATPADARTDKPSTGGRQ